MIEHFFEDPILNSPYERSARHWEFNKDGISTHQIVERRRESRLITTIPKNTKQGGKKEQRVLALEAQVLLESNHQYEVTQKINRVCALADEWRQLSESYWKMTTETARLIQHWHHHEFQGIKPFFFPIETAETASCLTEVAPEIHKRSNDILEKVESENDEDHLLRIFGEADIEIVDIEDQIIHGNINTSAISDLSSKKMCADELTSVTCPSSFSVKINFAQKVWLLGQNIGAKNQKITPRKDDEADIGKSLDTFTPFLPRHRWLRIAAKTINCSPEK